MSRGCAPCSAALPARSGDDLAQETFLAAWRAAGSWRGDSSYFTWLARIGWRQFLSHHAAAMTGRAARCGSGDRHCALRGRATERPSTRRWQGLRTGSAWPPCFVSRTVQPWRSRYDHGCATGDVKEPGRPVPAAPGSLPGGRSMKEQEIDRRLAPCFSRPEPEPDPAFRRSDWFLRRVSIAN